MTEIKKESEIEPPPRQKLFLAEDNKIILTLDSIIENEIKTSSNPMIIIPKEYYSPKEFVKLQKDYEDFSYSQLPTKLDNEDIIKVIKRNLKISKNKFQEIFYFNTLVEINSLKTHIDIIKENSFELILLDQQSLSSDKYCRQDAEKAPHKNYNMQLSSQNP